MLWDFQMDPREERRRRIDLSVPRFQGKPDGAVTIVEYADMECGYCRFRGTQMDVLLEANSQTLSYKRYTKFFPLWFSHAWSMKAASAAECIFRFAGQAMFAFKKQVYSQQPTITVSGIDELAITFAEGSGIPRTDFLNCYLREESLAGVRKDLEEGQRLGVKSTPTYFVDGTEITWVEDKVMEDFLRARAPNLKSISYETKP
jgi:protein-disulfide isomerase